LIATSIAFGLGLLSTAEAQQQPQQQQQAQQQQQPQQQQQQPQQFPQFGPQPQNLDDIWQMQKQQTRARIAGAVEQLRTACQEELRNFCSTVTPGEGRLLLCMQAHDDKIGKACELALLETSHNIGNAVRKMENFAQACWQDVQVLCSGTAGSVTKCVIDKRASLSPRCQAMVAETIAPAASPGQPPQTHVSMIGLPIYSADGMMLGQVTGLRRRPDGSLEAIEAELGSPLGMGGTNVLISPTDLRWAGDRIELQMMAEQVRNVLQGQQGQQGQQRP
jgi:hypothetical protein